MMPIAATAVRTALLLFSLLGYVHTAAKKLRAEFAVGAVFACIGSVMFLAGILNILQAAAWAVCLGGALLAIRAIRRRESFRDMLCVGYLFFLAMGLVLIWVLYGAEFSGHDNFSHWAKVTKLMLREHRVPNFLNTDLGHQSYPTGSGSFIYYMLSIAGTEAEWVQMYAQTMLSVGMSVALFAFTDRLELQGLTAAAAVTLFSCSVRFRDLFVDTLLPMIALGGIGVLLYYRKDLSDKLWWSIPYGVFVMSVKNSGLFFSAVLVLYALVRIKKDRTSLRRWLVCALSPFLALFLWQRHVAIVFEQGLNSNHAMTLSHFTSVFSARPPEEIRAVAAAFVRKVFSWSDPVIFLVALQLLLFLYVRFWRRQSCRPLGGFVCLLALSYGAYMLSFLGMYLFDMSGSVAVTLIGYDRYYATLLVFLAGISWIELMEQTALPPAPPLGKRAASAAFSLALLALLYLSLGSPILHRFQRQDLTRPEDWREQARYIADAFLADNEVPRGKTYIVLRGDEYEYEFYEFLFEYLLDSKTVLTRSADTLRADSGLLEGCDYLLVLDETEDTRAYMADVFGDPDLRMAALARADAG